MVGIELMIPEIERLCDLLEKLSRDIEIIKSKISPCRAWYSLREACILKGVNYKTLCNKPHLQPRRGHPDGIVSGKRMWRSETINWWLEITDQDLESSL